LIVIILGSCITIRNSYLPSRAALIQTAADKLILTYPGQKFSLYDYNLNGYQDSVDLGLILSFKGVEDAKGLPLGLGCNSVSCLKGSVPVLGSGLDIITANKLSGKGWKKVNADDVYNEVIGWSKKSDSLVSTFSLKKYIMNRIGFKN
jgi:hypothetical protein